MSTGKHEVDQIQDSNTFLTLLACLASSVFLKATANLRRTTGSHEGALLHCLIEYLAQTLLEIFCLIKLGAITVSQASSNDTDGIKGVPSFDTRPIVTLKHLVCEHA